MPLLEVAGLSIDYYGKRLIEDLSFMVARGDRFGIVGEKGFDKELIALALTGLLPRAALRGGQIRFDGKDLPTGEGAMARLRGTRIGVVFADPREEALPRVSLASQLAALVRRGRPDAAPGIEVPRLLGQASYSAAEEGWRAGGRQG